VWAVLALALFIPYLLVLQGANGRPPFDGKDVWVEAREIGLYYVRKVELWWLQTFW
jgi:hypothetical protein